jgi:alanine racemase
MNIAQLIVNKHSLFHNFQIIKKNIQFKTKILIVLKANAYGLGAVEIAKYAVELGADYLGVARVEEGVELRENGVNSSILVFANSYEEQFRSILNYDLEATITDYNVLKDLHRFLELEKKPVKVQLKINTGMNRLGFEAEELDLFLKLIETSNYIILTGIYTHFSSADEKNGNYTDIQNELFAKIYKLYKERYPNVIFHAANSAATMNFPETHYDMVRCGIMFYGSYPTDTEELDWNLKHVIQLQAKIIQVKNVKKNNPISYNRTFVTKRDSLIATVGIGYGDGIKRSLSNHGFVLIHDKVFPIVGKISMDQLMVDVTGSTGINIGDEAVLIGDFDQFNLKLHQIAKSIESVPYEILTSINPRVKRIYTGL